MVLITVTLKVIPLLRNRINKMNFAVMYDDVNQDCASHEQDTWGGVHVLTADESLTEYICIYISLPLLPFVDLGHREHWR